VGRILVAGLFALVLGLVCGPRFILWLRRRGIGQTIRSEGPEHHSVKQGTPTMGGLLILVAAIVPYLVLSRKITVPSLLVILLMVGAGLIGLADDLTKLMKKRSLGLKARTKILAQAVLFSIVIWLALRFAGVDTSVMIPLLKTPLNLGPAYFIVAFLVIAGFSNAVNLTDGLDGLAAGTVSACILAYMGITLLRNEPDLSLLAASLVGACVGFLWFNTFPASVFMGDTGSLALGASLAGFSLVTGTELLVVLVGGIFVVEALSVVIQVISFRFFHRRVFLMTPIHHHFELKNWSETKIIVRFWIVSTIFAAAGFTIFYLDMK
jgi:phospho-N-acetylmuramoyl-pentapeptide-transferase